MGSRGAAEPGYSEQIARFAAALGDRSPAPEVTDAIRTRIVDTLGCMIGAADVDVVRRARELAYRFTGAAGGDIPGASVVGSASRLPVEAAAFVNGIAARYLDFNDIYLSREAIHPSDNLAVAFAAAEALGCDGRALVRAAVLGYEVHCHLADVLSTRKGGWDNVVLGAMAASVMAGSLLGLDVTKQAHAINIAATGNVALMQTRVGALSMWKAAAAANAARAGLFAALLAEEGITGPNHALDGTHGLFVRVTGVPEGVAFERTGERLQLLDTHLKAYPSQYFTQTAIDAALAVRPKIRRDSIRRIEVATFEFGRVAAADSPEKWQPATRETADHSMPYCVAAALLDGAIGEAQFAIERIVRDDVRALMPKIEVVELPEFTRQYPSKVPSRIAVEHLDGSRVEALVDYPRGHSRNPMRRDQVEAKFLDLTHGRPRQAELLGALWRLEALSSAETGALLREAIGAAH